MKPVHKLRTGGFYTSYAHGHIHYNTMQVESGSIHKRIPHIHRWFPEPPPIDNANSLNNDMDFDQFSWSLIQHTVRLSNAEEKQSVESSNIPQVMTTSGFYRTARGVYFKL